MLNKLVIINNEKVFSEKDLFYCDNIEMKSLPEGLGKNFDISMILRKSKIQRSHQIKINKINLSSNIFNFLLKIYKTFKNKETNYLLISITPYTFLAHFILLIFKRKIFLYLRSNGHEEYKAIFGFIGPLLYHFMYIFVTFRSKIIVCQNKITNKKKVDLVYPSQLDKSWLINTTAAPMDKPRLLYVGRIKVEKGIFSLIKILENTSFNFELTIVGKPSNLKLNNNKIKYIGYENNPEKLRKIYDSHNIFILPSFTEAHPQALDESLARQRPAIIFEEISHVIQNKKGVFVTKRKTENLIQTINFIMNNYKNIIQSIKKNDLPSKEKFIEQMKDILNSN